MEYFGLSKYQTVQENILYSSMVLYNLIDEEIEIDELFNKYADVNNITLNLNIERILFLCLIFLYSIEKIKLNGNYIKRDEK